MPSTNLKQISAWATAKEKRQIVAAARRDNRSVSSWVIMAALEKAQTKA